MVPLGPEGAGESLLLLDAVASDARRLELVLGRRVDGDALRVAISTVDGTLLADDRGISAPRTGVPGSRFVFCFINTFIPCYNTNCGCGGCACFLCSNGEVIACPFCYFCIQLCAAQAYEACT
jgi:hypothetical protein